MVKNPGTPAGTGATKPLNAPQPVSVRVDENGALTAIRIEASIAGRRSHRFQENRRRLGQAKLKSIRSDGAWINVASVEDVWKINSEWWRGREHEIERVYYSLSLEGGQAVTIFHDLIADRWSRQWD